MLARAALLALLAAPAPAPAQEAWVDPELRAPLAALAGMEPLTAENLPAMREAWQAPAAASDILREEVIAGPGGDLRLLVLDPDPGASGKGGILHLHGGGYVMGAPDQDVARNDALARACGCVVVSPQYRLAPEHPFPAPLDDAMAALRWLHDNAEGLGVDPARLAVLGESAGGGLAAMTAIRARDEGEVALAFQALIYPMLDDRTVARAAAGELPAQVGRHVWTRSDNALGWGALLGREPGGTAAPAGAVPAREEVAGLPPAWIGVGALDLFVEEDIAYAARLVRAGVPTTLLVVPGAYHGFDGLAPEAAASRAFTASWRAALIGALAPEG